LVRQKSAHLQRISDIMPRSLVISLLLAAQALAADSLLLCGGDEIFQIDPAANPPAKLWTWRSKDHPGIPQDLRDTFRTTDECKPHDNGKRLLITSSGGGCAMLEFPSGKPLWWARATNAHSIEALPGGLIAVAASVGKGGDKVLLFDEKVPMEALAEIPLPSAHGLVWDDARKILWALGFGELIACSVEGRRLAVKSRHKLPDPDGHDLRPVPASPELILSTHAGVWRFHRDDAVFRPDPDLQTRVAVKSVDIHPRSGRLAVIHPSGKTWWSDTLELLKPAAKHHMKGETLYKARWLTADD
jgi:hypothetical protein